MNPRQTTHRSCWTPGHGLVLLVLAAGIPCTAFAQVAPVSAPTALRYQPIPGAESVYQIVSQGDMSLDYGKFAKALDPRRRGSSAGQTATHIYNHVYDVSAQLHTRALERKNDAWLVAMRLKDVQLTLDGEKDPRTQWMETEFLVTVQDDGTLRDIQFSTGFPEDLALLIRGLVEPTQVKLDAKGQKSWTSIERSAESTSNLNYEIVGEDPAAGVVRIQRTKTACMRKLPTLPGDSGRSVEAKTGIDQSSGEIEWSTATSSLKRINFREQTTTMHQGKVLARHKQFFSATAVPGEVMDLSRTAAQANARLADDKAARMAFYRVAPEARTQLKDINVETLLPAIQQRVLIRPAEGAFLMTQYVRRNPWDSSAVVRKLVAEPVTNEQEREFVGMGLSSLALAGHREAQQALVDALSDTSLPNVRRELALTALLSIPMPERFVPASVWAYRESLPGAGSKATPRLSIATNVYGSLGATSHGVQANTDEVLSTLLERLRTTQSMDEKRLMLVALGNVGDYRRVLPATDSYFRSSNDVLRMRAFETFLGAAGDDAFNQFATRYAQQTSRDVILAAAAIAVTMPTSAARTRWAAEQSRTVQDPAILSHVVDILGRDLKDNPSNTEVLQDLLKRTTDRETRKKIYRFISPVHAAEGGAQ